MSTATATSMKLTAEQESENARINAENERLRKQARAKRTISLTLSYVALALVTFLMIFPLIIVVIVSFTPNAVTQTWPPKIIPSAWTLDNYTSLFQRLPIGRELLNTIVFAGAVTIISVFFDSLAAYGLSRVDFKGRGILLAVLIATMMIPAMALLIPVYKLLGSMGLVNSYLGIIIPRMADVGGIFLLRQFFISIPKDLDNAARIDGAGEFRIFAQIILPNAVPAILTVGMFNFMGNWNDLLWPLIMTSKPETRTITAGLAMFFGRYLAIVLQLAIAWSLLCKKRMNESIGTLKTNNIGFGVIVAFVVYIFAALTFFPALALGPIAEHLSIWLPV